MSFFYFHPQPVKAHDHPPESGTALGFVLQGSFPLHDRYRTLLAVDGSVGLLLIVLSALRRLCLWLSALQIKVD